MDLIKIENYGIKERNFQIYTYRDNNNDALIIETAEIASGRKIDFPDNSGRVPMNGNFKLEPHEYAGYDEELIKVKNSIRDLDRLPNMFTKITEKETVALKDGDIIIRYPMHGNPTDSVNIKNKNELTVMKVSRIFEDDVDLLFEVPDEPIFVDFMRVKMGPLHKTKTQLIEEKRWWLYNQ